MGAGVSYMYSVDDSAGPFATAGWWSTSIASISAVKKNTKDKIVQLFTSSSPDWSEIGLVWKEKTNVTVTEKTEISQH